MEFKEIKSLYRQSLKSMDTEEHIDLFFYRPLGFAWAWLFAKLGVTPNVVTIASIFLGVGGGILLYFAEPANLWLNYVGIFLIIWANTYDSADGQLARMTGKKTRWGRILDGFAGDVWFVAIYVAICLRLMPQWGIWIWVLCSFAGFICHGKQCQLADYYRNIHLYFIKGEQGSELDNAAKLTEEFKSLSWGKDFAWKLFLYFYRNYTKSQEGMTPAFQHFKKEIDQRYGRAIPENIKQEFRAGSLPLMKWANILTFNTRAIVLYISLLVNQPWIYPAFEITVMNGLFFYMRAKHESLCRRMEGEITKA